jgi:hypothetical protein
MVNLLPDSLKLEIIKFLKGFHLDPTDVSVEGITLAFEHLKKQKDENKDLFDIKHHLSLALGIDTKNKGEKLL